MNVIEHPNHVVLGVSGANDSVGRTIDDYHSFDRLHSCFTLVPWQWTERFSNDRAQAPVRWPTSRFLRQIPQQSVSIHPYPSTIGPEEVSRPLAQ
jgi:hypothetical protein